MSKTATNKKIKTAAYGLHVNLQLFPTLNITFQMKTWVNPSGNPEGLWVHFQEVSGSFWAIPLIAIFVSIATVSKKPCVTGRFINCTGRYHFDSGLFSTMSGDVFFVVFLSLKRQQSTPSWDTPFKSSFTDLLGTRDWIKNPCWLLLPSGNSL